MRFPTISTNRLESLECAVENMNRRPKLWLSLMALMFAVQIGPWWYPKLDGCLYLSVARAILPGESSGLGHALNPGYPILISPAFLFGDRPFLAVSVLHWLMAVACILGVYQWTRRQFPAYAVLLTGAAMLNASVWIHYRRTIKELAFMTVVVWTVVIADKLIREKRRLHTFLLCTAMTILIGYAVLIRYPGIVLAAGFGLAMLASAWRKQLTLVRAITLTLAVGLPPSFFVVQRMAHEEQLAQQLGIPTYKRAFDNVVKQLADELLFAYPTTGRDKPPSNDTDANAADRESPTTVANIDDSAIPPLTAHVAVREPQDVEKIVTDESDNVPRIAVSESTGEVPSNAWASLSEFTQRLAQSQMVSGLMLRISSIGQITLPGMFKAYTQPGVWLHINVFIYAIWFLVILTGWWYIVKRRLDVLALSLPFFIALYIIWPSDQGARFLVPMAPILMASAWFGMRRLFVRRSSVLATCVAVHLAVALIYWVAKDAPRAWALHQEWPHVDKLAADIINDDSDRSTAVVGIDPSLRSKFRAMFQLVVDRPMEEFDDLNSVPDSVHWVVAPQAIPLTNSFVPIETAGQLQLIARRTIANRPIVPQTADHAKPAADAIERR